MEENSGPCASYTDRLWRDRPPKFIGYDAVGPGWRGILEILDRITVRTIENAKANALHALPKYKDAENTAEASVEVLQIKEKFGGLRVYFETKGMSTRFREYLNGAVSFAECLSLQTCEKCGSMENVATEPKREYKYSRVLTLCAEHREERAESKVFQIGNDKVYG